MIYMLNLTPSQLIGYLNYPAVPWVFVEMGDGLSAHYSSRTFRVPTLRELNWYRCFDLLRTKTIYKNQIGNFDIKKALWKCGVKL
jgi:hypothetical protein